MQSSGPAQGVQRLVVVLHLERVGSRQLKFLVHWTHCVNGTQIGLVGTWEQSEPEMQGTHWLFVHLDLRGSVQWELAMHSTHFSERQNGLEAGQCEFSWH